VLGDGLGERLDVDRLVVAEPLDLCLAPGDVDQPPSVGGVAGGPDAHVSVGLVYLLDALGDL